MTLTRTMILLICLCTAVSAQADCDNHMYNVAIRGMRLTYSCDVESNAALNCLSAGGGDGSAHMEIYNRLVDSTLGLVATDYQIGGGGTLESNAMYQGPSRHCYDSNAYLYMREWDENGNPGEVIIDSDMYGGWYCCDSQWGDV